MQSQTTLQKENCTLDILKLIASMLVTACHTPVLFSTETSQVYFNGWFIRFCVPFFFATTGYFYCKSRNKLRNLKRLAWLFAFSYMLYLPNILEGVGSIQGIFSKLRWNLIIGYEHLWYLSAVMAGILVWYFLERVPVLTRLLRILEIPVSVALLMIGALLNMRYLTTDVEILHQAGNFLLIFGGPRNVVFMGLPLMLLGGCMARSEDKIRKIPTWVLLVLWVVLRALAFGECRWLYSRIGAAANTDMSYFGMWPGLILLELSFRVRIPIPERPARLLRKLSEYIYVLHPLVMAQISKCLELPPAGLFVMTIVMCVLIYVLLEKQFSLNTDSGKSLKQDNKKRIR